MLEKNSIEMWCVRSKNMVFGAMFVEMQMTSGIILKQTKQKTAKKESGTKFWYESAIGSFNSAFGFPSKMTEKNIGIRALRLNENINRYRIVFARII